MQWGFKGKGKSPEGKDIKKAGTITRFQKYEVILEST
jgi:hypothetical protein